MATLVKAVCKFQRISGIPSDVVENDWFFHWNDASVPVLSDYSPIAAALEKFYGERNTGQSLAVGEYMSEALNRTPGFSVTYYVQPLPNGPLGAPVGVVPSVAFYAAAAGVPLPSECAAVLSFARSYGSAVEFGAGGSRPRARCRGRVYLGPLQGGANTETEDSTIHEVTILNGLRVDATTAAAFSFKASATSSPLHTTHWTWSQYSAVDGVSGDVTSCWMDNAFDTQRRRGQEATARTTVTI